MSTKQDMLQHYHDAGSPWLATRKPQALLARFFFRALLCRSPLRVQKSNLNPRDMHKLLGPEACSSLHQALPGHFVLDNQPSFV